MGGLLHGLGIDDTSGAWYGFWSGFGSDLGEVALIGAILGAYHRHACHQDHCWRIGRHTVNGSPWCNRHHGQARAAEKGRQ